jgi:hypothetical protein
MTKRAKPPLHGRDHAPDGADPIPTVAGGGIQFDTRPQDGDWLYVETTGTQPDTTHTGIELVASQDIVQEGRRISLEADTENINVSSDESTVDVFGQDGVTITGNGDTGVVIAVNGAGDVWIQLQPGNNLKISGLPTIAGAAGNVYNSSGTLKIS